MGWIYAAFIWGYALCQLPGGILGKRFGPRLALASVGLVWIITTALTGWLPGHIFTTGSGIIASLLIVRFLVGVAHAPIYPIQAAVVERWFPVGHWALPNAVSSTGLTLGRRCCATIWWRWSWSIGDGASLFTCSSPLGSRSSCCGGGMPPTSRQTIPLCQQQSLPTYNTSRQQLTQDVWLWRLEATH